MSLKDRLDIETMPIYRKILGSMAPESLEYL